MSRYIRTAGSTGGGSGYSDSSVCALMASGVPDAMGVCNIRTDWEILYQCDPAPSKNFGNCIEFAVDTDKYFGFKFIMNGFCGDVCTNCGIHFAVQGADSCYCSCNCTNFVGMYIQSACNCHCCFVSYNANVFSCTMNSAVDALTKVEYTIISSGYYKSDWIACMSNIRNNCGQLGWSVGSSSCGAKWCDIGKMKIYPGGAQNLIASCYGTQDDVRGAGYLAVYGLKNPNCCSICNVTYTESS
jgi:hypothetical protein